jgi:O-methyltransferase
MRREINKYILQPLGYKLFKENDGYHHVPDIYGHQAIKILDPRKDSAFRNLARKVIDDKTTLLYYDRLHVRYQALQNLKRQKPVIVEAGVDKGESSYFAASVAQKFFSDDIKMFSIDTFEGHSGKDLPFGKEGTSNAPGGFNDTDYEAVTQYLQPFSFVTVIKNRVQDCATILEKGIFSFVHLDMDLYAPTKFALDFFGSKKQRGGIVVVDDYSYKTAPGIRKAVDEYWGKTELIKFEMQTGQAVLIKL